MVIFHGELLNNQRVNHSAVCTLRLSTPFLMVSSHVKNPILCAATPFCWGYLERLTAGHRRFGSPERH